MRNFDNLQKKLRNDQSNGKRARERQKVNEKGNENMSLIRTSGREKQN